MEIEVLLWNTNIRKKKGMFVTVIDFVVDFCDDECRWDCLTPHNTRRHTNTSGNSRDRNRLKKYIQNKNVSDISFQERKKKKSKLSGKAIFYI